MLDAGAEPRQLLRYAPAPGARERVEVDFKLRIDARTTNTVLETRRDALDSPTVRRTLVLEAQPIAGSGDMRVSCVIDDVVVLDDVVDPALRARVEAAVQRTKGVRGSWRVSPSGRVTELAFEAPPDATREVREQLAHLGESLESWQSVYPDVPVGAGATWRVSALTTRARASWATTTTYTLRELTATSATFESDLTATAASQALRVEPNRSVRLENGSSHGHAHTVVGFGRIAASSQLETTTELDMQIVERHLRVTSSSTLDALVVIRPANAAR